MREIILDTETTGLDPSNGDRIIEIGCIELVNHVATGKSYQQYINPERWMPEEAYRIHGLTEEFLADFPIMSDIIDEFLEFIGDSILVIHNAEFDIKFINSELKRLNKPVFTVNSTIDTMKLARDKFPGASVSLDALCKRFQVDNSNRTLHGALLDADLLALVYLELLGGKQPNFDLINSGENIRVEEFGVSLREPRVFNLTEQEKSTHSRFIEKLVKPVWKS